MTAVEYGFVAIFIGDQGLPSVANIPRCWCGNLRASGDVAMARYRVGLLMIAFDGKNHGL
jgi:hypothetical protein